MTVLTPSSKIFVAGHRGLVGSALVRGLQRCGLDRLVTRTHQELDLTSQTHVREFFEKEKIDFVFLAAAKVGGIEANRTAQADFLYENLMIAANVIHAAFDYGVKKLLFLGSSCIYPKHALQPLKEDSLLTGPLEPTNEGYAIAKIAGLKLCEKIFSQYGREFISAMPTNLYGPGDNFHPTHSHVIPGMLRRFHEARVTNAPVVKIWGSGKPYREFLHCDDLTDALILLVEKYSSPETINVGSGLDLSISELAHLIQKVTGYEGKIEFDPTLPDGTPKKLLDVGKIFSLGWRPKISLEKGLVETYVWAKKSGVLANKIG